jgi:hypothetical protein
LPKSPRRPKSTSPSANHPASSSCANPRSEAAETSESPFTLIIRDYLIISDDSFLNSNQSVT